MVYSHQNIQQWRAYERVRSSGKFNMFDPQAMAASGLTKGEYLFCMKNYGPLKDAADPRINGFNVEFLGAQRARVGEDY